MLELIDADLVKIITPFVLAILGYAAAIVKARLRKTETLGAFTETQLKLLIEQQRLEIQRLSEVNERQGRIISELRMTNSPRANSSPPPTPLA